MYLETKAGGTRQETRLQKTEGDVDALREDLIKALGMEQNPADVVVNRLNNHIIVKVGKNDMKNPILPLSSFALAPFLTLKVTD